MSGVKACLLLSLVHIVRKHRTFSSVICVVFLVVMVIRMKHRLAFLLASYWMRRRWCLSALSALVSNKEDSLVENKCETFGHEWHSTSVFGWFQCHRVIDLKMTKKKSTLIYCNMVAHCPGCVGVRYANVLVVWCVAHEETCNIEDFRVVGFSSGASSVLPPVEQQSLF